MNQLQYLYQQRWIRHCGKYSNLYYIFLHRMIKLQSQNYLLIFNELDLCDLQCKDKLNFKSEVVLMIEWN